MHAGKTTFAYSSKNGNWSPAFVSRQSGTWNQLPPWNEGNDAHSSSITHGGGGSSPWIVRNPPSSQKSTRLASTSMSRKAGLD